MPSSLANETDQLFLGANISVITQLRKSAINAIGRFWLHQSGHPLAPASSTPSSSHGAWNRPWIISGPLHRSEWSGSAGSMALTRLETYAYVRT